MNQSPLAISVPVDAGTNTDTNVAVGNTNGNGPNVREGSDVEASEEEVQGCTDRLQTVMRHRSTHGLPHDLRYEPLRPSLLPEYVCPVQANYRGASTGSLALSENLENIDEFNNSGLNVSRHNRFNPQLYNYSMATSPTMANLNSCANCPPRPGERSQWRDAPSGSVDGTAEESGNESVDESTEPVVASTSESVDGSADGSVSGYAPVSAEGTSNGSADGSADGYGGINHILNEQGSNKDIGEQSETTASPATSDSGDAIDLQSIPQVATAADATSDSWHDLRGKPDENGFYSIRLTPFIDHSSSAPYMFFGPIIRKIKPGMSIPMGRYTEKCRSAATAPQGSSAAVVFKSKVVSRQHAQLTVDEDGQWHIRDVSSSSGTFLNHLRLSLANVESGEFALNDSDILQLGMDYRGGSEEIYRCVKVKVELNFSWRRRGAKFSKEAHKRLKELTLTRKDEDLTPCVICLGPIKPCQAVFVSSCSHSWHYKCIRPLIVKTYPQFMCPNCKAVCDIEADLDDEDQC
ncbi:hypothetical protein FOA43_001447 [Brettanomyces nanus]|uniref:RING-type E3 ubiquitin transferase n=1 Tax=Eeniella nana TaxID=13502 RepID=A0A875S1B3_EENNA|nr:uncharacterized protein FOA43_001447 [Brettanomyces nanus]QPG74125.1 hypothetical protein FOA43_001447 [Brettanomyces nanus]